MRDVVLSAILVGGVLVACNESEVDGSGCADISGNYDVKYERVSGSCDPKVDGALRATLSFSKDADGAWSVVIPGLEGGCPGSLDASSCKFVANCKAMSKTDGSTLATYSVDYKFTGTTIAGSSITALLPPTATPACDVTYKETGTKL